MGVTVLIVDDDEAVRFFHRIIISQSGLSKEPVCFSDGESVFNYLDQYSKKTETYLMLLDINMPFMNGWDLLNAMIGKPYYNEVYTVIVTSSVERMDHEKAKLYNMVIGVVEKPISDEDCKKIIHSSPIASRF